VTGVVAASSFRGGLRLPALARLAGGRRLAAGRRFAVVRRFAAVRRFAVVRRFTVVRFFRDERVVAARFLRFAICCLLGGENVFIVWDGFIPLLADNRRPSVGEKPPLLE
jgi:hypothetical protein